MRAARVGVRSGRRAGVPADARARVPAGVRVARLAGALAIAFIGSSAAPWVGMAAAATPEPPVPAAATPADPARVRVALVDSGVDYRLPLIRDALARHPDGTMVGIDFRDLDDRPFDAVPARGGVRRHGTAVASVLLAEAPSAALVPYRYPGQDMRLMHALVEHAAAVGVRLVGLPLGSDDAQRWQAFAAAAAAHPELLFVASAGNDGRDLGKRPLYPASLPLDNLLVVTSADDSGRASAESGIGRSSVDWLIPAEAVPVIGFDGVARIAAGSSYAVPRLLARLVREIESVPSSTPAQLIARLRSAHANGLQPRSVADGLMIDPLADTVGELHGVPLSQPLEEPDERAGRGDPAPHAAFDTDPVTVPIDIFALGSSWSDEAAAGALTEASAILRQCGVRAVAGRRERWALDEASRLADLHIGAAATLFDRIGRSGGAPRIAVLLARDTRMQIAFDAEAFGAANTRGRTWMRHSIWMTSALADRRHDAGIALAHELWHVLADRGDHVDAPGNLMRARTDGDNRALDVAQCVQAREGAVRQRLASAS